MGVAFLFGGVKIGTYPRLAWPSLGDDDATSSDMEMIEGGIVSFEPKQRISGEASERAEV